MFAALDGNFLNIFWDFIWTCKTTYQISLCSSHEQLEMIAERSIKEADKQGRGYMVFEEFEEAIKEVDIEGEMAFVSFYWKNSVKNIVNYLTLSL